MPPSSIDFLIDVINLLPNPVYVKNRDHLWVEANKSFCELLGYSREKLLGKSDFDFTPAEQAKIFWEMDDITFKSRKKSTNIEQTTNRNGEIRWVESVKSYYEDQTGEPFIIGVLTDITELKNREAALVIAEQRAREASVAKSEFLANMSHEIRTPMNGVLGMASVLHATSMTDEQREIVDVIERSGDALLNIINDILDFSKMEAGKLQLDQGSFLLREVVEDIATLLRTAANTKGIELIVNIEESIPSVLIGDAGRIRQILINLVGNGIKFTKEGYVILDVQSHIVGTKTNLEFSIRDTGIGIPVEKFSSIFNEFEQVDGSTTRHFGGTGLGLAISRNLIEMMGGNISIRSKLGEGSTFSFEITLPHDDQAVIAAKHTHMSIDFSSLRGLVIDDIDINLTILRSNLENVSMQVDTVSGVREAIALLNLAANNDTPYDLVITDFQMPEINGLTLVKALKQSKKFQDIPVIVLSSVDTIDCKTNFQKLNVDSFLIKPVKPTILIQEIQKATSSKPQKNVTTINSQPNNNKKRTPSHSESEGRLLIAEDNEINRNVVQRMLGTSRYKLDFAMNGKTAFELYQRNKYDLILMDISMPIMDGILSTSAIRAYETEHGLARTAIIALTAHASNEHRQKFLSAQMDDFLAKPFNNNDLYDKVNHWINISNP